MRVFRWRTRELLWKANAGRAGALVVHVGFSPDGRRLATSDWQGRVRIYGAESGQLLLTNSSDTERPSAVAFSPDGALLAIAGLRPYLVDVKKGTILRELRGHLAATTALSFSRDGQRIATLSADQTARIFDTATAMTLHLLRVGAASSLELSPSGDRLLIAHPEDRSAKIYPASPQALLAMACALIQPQPEWEQVRPLCQGSMK